MWSEETKKFFAKFLLVTINKIVIRFNKTYVTA